MPRRNKTAERALALHRIRKLVALAGDSQEERRRRYVQLARRIAMRYQVSLPTDLRRRICRSCDELLVPGRTARVRVSQGRVAVTCLRCGSVRRFPYGVARHVAP